MKIKDTNMQLLLNNIHKSINIDSMRISSRSNKEYQIEKSENDIDIKHQYDIEMPDNFCNLSEAEVINDISRTLNEKLSLWIKPNKYYVTLLMENNYFIEKDGLILNMIYNDDMFKVSILVGTQNE